MLTDLKIAAGGDLRSLSPIYYVKSGAEVNVVSTYGGGVGEGGGGAHPNLPSPPAPSDFLSLQGVPNCLN